MKRSSCLFSTKERLRKVGQVLDKVKKYIANESPVINESPETAAHTRF